MRGLLISVQAGLARAPDIIRFGIVAVIGLIVDITVAYGASLWMALVPAAALGFAAGACVNYVLHELWTFRAGARQVSGARALKYAAALGATLAVRLVAVAVLARIFGQGQALLVLVLATGLSFGVNYLTSKLLVFRPERSPERPRNTSDKTDETL